MKPNLLHLVLALGLTALPMAVLHAQTAQPDPSTANPPPATRRKVTRPARKPATPTTSQPQTLTIPREIAPPSPPTADETARQKAADAALLQQQKADSEHARQINDQQVEQAQRQQDRIQNQTRVEDAPGPSQTGLVPAAGAPVAPTQTDTRSVQDAPGPSQTLPALPTVAPGQLPATPTQTTQTPASTTPPL